MKILVFSCYDKHVEQILLEYKIECQHAYNEFMYESIDDVTLESFKNKELTKDEQTKFKAYLNKIKSAKDKLMKKLSNKPAENNDKDKKIKMKFNLKKVKSAIDKDTKKMKENRNLILANPEVVSSIKKYGKTSADFLANNAETVISAGVAIADINNANKSIEKMSKEYDLINGTCGKVKDSDQRSAAMIAMQDANDTIGTYISILSDAATQVKY